MGFRLRRASGEYVEQDEDADGIIDTVANAVSDADTVDGYHASELVKKAGDTLAGDLTPESDCGVNLGEASLRFANIYGQNVYAGDMCFVEKECAICGKPLKVGDNLVLKVVEVGKFTHTVPAHAKCANTEGE